MQHRRYYRGHDLRNHFESLVQVREGMVTLDLKPVIILFTFDVSNTPQNLKKLSLVFNLGTPCNGVLNMEDIWRTIIAPELNSTQSYKDLLGDIQGVKTLTEMVVELFQERLLGVIIVGISVLGGWWPGGAPTDRHILYNLPISKGVNLERNVVDMIPVWCMCGLQPSLSL